MIHRVMVLGCSGAGKSTITSALARAWEPLVVHLDRHFRRPGWNRVSEQEWEDALRELIAEDTWFHDGNYVSTMPMRLPRADLVVFVDTPRRRCLYRVIKRRPLGNRIHDIPGCPERVDRQHLRYVWRFPTGSRPGLLTSVADHPNIVRLRSRRDVREFVTALSPRRPRPMRVTRRIAPAR